MPPKKSTGNQKKRISPRKGRDKDSESQDDSFTSTDSQEDINNSDTVPSSKSSSPSDRRRPQKPRSTSPENPKYKSVQKNKQTDTELNNSSYSCCVMIIGILAIVLIIVVGLSSVIPSFQYGSNVTDSCPANVDLKERFTNKFKELRKEFTAQDNEFWKKIKVPVLRVVQEDEPEYPAVILLVVPKGGTTSLTATCLAKNYITKLSNLHADGNEKGGYINVQSLPANSVDDVKYQLDNEMKHVFDTRSHKLHTVVIDHIEALDPQVMLLFHGYCDGDHAPYKKAVIILVLHTDLDTKVADDLDRVVDQHLQSLWQKSLDGDKIPPLIARVANNKAMIRDEKSESLC